MRATPGWRRPRGSPVSWRLSRGWQRPPDPACAGSSGWRWTGTAAPPERSAAPKGASGPPPRHRPPRRQPPSCPPWGRSRGRWTVCWPPSSPGTGGGVRCWSTVAPCRWKRRAAPPRPWRWWNATSRRGLSLPGTGTPSTPNCTCAAAGAATLLGEGHAVIGWLACRREKQGRGHGTAALLAAVRGAMEQGKTPLLACREELAAFYIARGFFLAGEVWERRGDLLSQ